VDELGQPGGAQPGRDGDYSAGELFVGRSAAPTGGRAPDAQTNGARPGGPWVGVGPNANDADASGTRGYGASAQVSNGSNVSGSNISGSNLDGLGDRSDVADARRSGMPGDVSSDGTGSAGAGSDGDRGAKYWLPVRQRDADRSPVAAPISPAWRGAEPRGMFEGGTDHAQLLASLRVARASIGRAPVTSAGLTSLTEDTIESYPLPTTPPSDAPHFKTSQSGTSQIGTSESGTSQLDTAQPEALQSQVFQPELLRSELLQPEMQQSDLPQPELPQPELPQPTTPRNSAPLSTAAPTSQLPRTQPSRTQLPSTQPPSTQPPSTQPPSAQLPTTDERDMNVDDQADAANAAAANESVRYAPPPSTHHDTASTTGFRSGTAAEQPDPIPQPIPQPMSVHRAAPENQPGSMNQPGSVNQQGSVSQPSSTGQPGSTSQPIHVNQAASVSQVNRHVMTQPVTVAYDEPAASSEPSALPPPGLVPLLPHRVPAPPDVPEVPDDDDDDVYDTDLNASPGPDVDGPELDRIANRLRDDEEPAEPPADLDVTAVLEAVRHVPGVADAQLRGNPGGMHTLRLDLADGADPGRVSRQVARLLKERMGLAAEPRRARPTAAPAPVTAPPIATNGSRSPRPRPATLTDVTPRGDAFGRSAPSVQATKSVQATRDSTTETTFGAQSGTTDSRLIETTPRVAVDQVRVSTLGTDATVEVRLVTDGVPSVGAASGPAFDGYLLRLAAQAAASAIDGLVEASPKAPQVRCFIDHAGVVPFGSVTVAVVVVLITGAGWVEQLVGSALVGGDPRQAIVRATLAAVNRRLESLLA
jgi:hypothetical protein